MQAFFAKMASFFPPLFSPVQHLGWKLSKLSQVKEMTYHIQGKTENPTQWIKPLGTNIYYNINTASL